MSDAPADLASIRVAASADAVYALIADPTRLSKWSFGTWETVLHGDGLIEGRAIVTAAPIWVRIDATPERRLVDYWVGTTPEALVPRIFARVVAGDATGHDAETCTLLLCALRSATTSDESWQSLQRTHAFEVELLRRLAEHTQT